MGEGAALLILEAEDVARARGAEPYVELLGYGASSDGHHMVQPRPDGTEAARAVSIALAGAGLAPDAIDYVNAHASSTPIGDVAEARALTLALGARASTVPVSGTKALYGHPLGASGAIEAVICCLAIRDSAGRRRRSTCATRTPTAPRCCRGCSAIRSRGSSATCCPHRSGSAG